MNFDIFGQISILSINGDRYFLTFRDYYSRRVWVYFLKNELKAFEKFKEFKALVEKSLDKVV